MDQKTYNVLFLCTGNSARSILSEGIMEKLGQGRFRAFSAGSHPLGRVNPYALETLQAHGHDTSQMRSKSWDEFAVPDAPKMDFIFTVCDNAAGEVCPIWPGQPMTAHWGFSDPSHVEGDEEAKRKAFRHTYLEITRRLQLFVSLPMDKLDHVSLLKQLKEMGESA